MMDNQGQIYATDTDGRRLTPIFDRLTRARARATSRCARRAASATSSPISPGAATSCWSTRRAAAPAPGGAIPTPNGACGPGALEQRIKDQDEDAGKR